MNLASLSILRGQLDSHGSMAYSIFPGNGLT